MILGTWNEITLYPGQNQTATQSKSLFIQSACDISWHINCYGNCFLWFDFAHVTTPAVSALLCSQVLMKPCNCTHFTHTRAHIQTHRRVKNKPALWRKVNSVCVLFLSVVVPECCFVKNAWVCASEVKYIPVSDAFNELWFLIEANFKSDSTFAEVMSLNPDLM